MTTEILHEFLVLADLLSYGRAADTLYISQPMLTRHIQSLEKELGVALFERSARGTALTDAGRLLAMQSGELLELCDTATNRLHLTGMPASGTLRAACNHELSCANHIRDFTRGFMERYREIDLRFEVLTGPMPETVLRDYDIVLSPCLYDMPGVERTLLFRHGIYAYVPPGHRIMSRQLASAADLAGETVLVPYASEKSSPYAENWRLLEHMLHGQINCLPVENLATAIFLLSAPTGGILLGPRYIRSMLAQDVFSSSMALSLRDDDMAFPEYLYLCTGRVNPSARLFAEELTAFCRK